MSSSVYTHIGIGFMIPVEDVTASNFVYSWFAGAASHLEWLDVFDYVGLVLCAARRTSNQHSYRYGTVSDGGLPDHEFQRHD